MKRTTDTDLIGLTAGRLTVEAVVGRTASRKRLVRCRCTCGNRTTICLSDLRNGHIQSCGCLHRETSSENLKRGRHLGEGNRLRHGRTKTPEYYIWRSMKARCLNSHSSGYPNYGARGITVCDRWRLFDHFFADMGLRPSPNHQLDRINNDGPYTPENCHWATPVQQGRNKRSNVVITYEGVTLTMIAWAQRLGITRHALWHRLEKRWPLERCLVGQLRKHNNT